MFPHTANRWHEQRVENGVGNEPSAFAQVASRTAPAWWTADQHETSIADGSEQINGQGRRLPNGSASNGTSMGNGTSKTNGSSSTGHASRPPNVLATRSPPRTLPQSRPTWSALPHKGPATCELCCFCFQVLLAQLQGQSPPPFPALADPTFKAPLFVTWMKRRKSRNGSGQSVDSDLRGCIGCLEPVVFSPGLSEYAIRSSLQDKRFPPIQLEELPSLTAKLSILHKFETCSHVYDWQVGLHGILINFLDAHGRRYSATYLPEIAQEHGMTREVAIRELVIKSGYPGPCTEDILDRMQVQRYQSLVEGIAYGEYLSLSGAEVSAPGCQG